MTRRLTVTILAALWAMLIVGGAVAYFTTRQILLEDLDHTLLIQALVSAKSEYPEDYPELPTGAEARVYLLEVRKPMSGDRSTPPPEILRRAFTDNGMRTITARAFYAGGKYHDVVASLPTRRFDSHMQKLLWWVGGFIVLTGVAVAAIARAIARSALKPLIRTAETIGTINERRLDRRIDSQSLPEELHPMADRLNDMLARLETSFGARRQFLADASHELRTPVAALVTSLEVTLGRQRTAEQYEEVLRQALSDAQFLQQLSEGLLEAARSERDPVDAGEPVDVSALTSSCCLLLKPLADPRQVSLSQDVSPGIVSRLDGRRLKSIVINLISNAIEYNRPTGGVSVELRLGEPGAIPPAIGNAEAVKTGIVLTVRDTGIGIAPEHVQKVFDPFFRVDTVRTQGEANEGSRTSHLGLGLALVRRHVDALGGTLHVSSKKGDGTTFVVVLPARIAGGDAGTSANGSADVTHAALMTSGRAVV